MREIQNKPINLYADGAPASHGNGNSHGPGYHEQQITFKSRIRYMPRAILGAVTACLVAVVLAPPMLFVSLFTDSKVPGQTVGYIWSWLTAKALGVKAELIGNQRVEQGLSYIVTPNHQGALDVLALELALPVKILWVIKKELTRIPFFGWALGRSGAICLDRSNLDQAIKALNSGSKKLTGGWSLLAYPEGTRSREGRLGEFKKGPFMLAVQTGAPILPVAINGAYKLLPRKSCAFRPGRMTVTICDPIPTRGLTISDVPELMGRTRAAIEERLDLNYDPFI